MTERHLVLPSVKDVKELKCCKIRTVLVGSSDMFKLMDISSSPSKSVSTRSTDIEYMSADGSGLRSSTNSVFGELPAGDEYTHSEFVLVHFPHRGFSSSHWEYDEYRIGKRDAWVRTLP